LLLDTEHSLICATLTHLDRCCCGNPSDGISPRSCWKEFVRGVRASPRTPLI
jgi:hypothetical protein